MRLSIADSLFRVARVPWKRVRAWRLSTQLAGLTALIMGSAILINSLADAAMEAREIETNLTREAQTQAANIAGAGSHFMLVGDLAGLEEVLLRAAQFPSVRAIQVTDTQGRVLSRVLRHPGQGPKVVFGEARLAVPAVPASVVQRHGDGGGGGDMLDGSDGFLTVWVPVDNGTRLGWARVDYDLAAVSAGWFSVFLRHLVFGGSAAVVSGLLVWLFTRRTARDLVAASDFAAQLDSRRGEQIQLPHSSFEVMSLDLALNRASLRLRQQEDALAAVNAHLQATLRNAGDGIVTVGMEGRIASFNLAAEKMFGRPASEVVGQGISLLFADDDWKDATRGLLRVSGEVTGRRADGSVFPLELSVNEISSPEREVIMIVRDVSERKRNEAEILALHHFNQLILDSTADGLIGLDVQGEVTFVNEAAAQMVGWSKEELVGRSGHPLLHHTRADGAPYPECDCPSQIVLTEGKGVRVSDEVFWRKNGTRFPVEYVVSPVFEQGRISGVVVAFRDITERKRAEAHIRHIAHHDALTGLPNRVLMQDRLQHALGVARRNKTLTAVMFLDLDRFKQINDTLGHDVGDALLQAVAGRLGECVREIDTVARLGGDEFVIILHEMHDLQDAHVVARKVLDALSAPFIFGRRRLEVSASIGISVFPAHGKTIQELMKNADIAMYSAKASGRNAYCVYLPEMRIDIAAAGG